MKKFVDVDLNKVAVLTVSKAQKALSRILRKKGMGYFQARSLARGGAELSFKRGGEKGLKRFVAGVSKGIQKKPPKHYKTLPKNQRAYQFQADWERGHRAIYKKKRLPTEVVPLKKKLLAAGSLAATAGSLYILSSGGKGKKPRKPRREESYSSYPIYQGQRTNQQYIRTKLREM